MKKRMISTLLTVAMATTIVAGSVSVKAEGNEEKVQITYMENGNATFQERLEKVVEEFEKLNPNIEVVSQHTSADQTDFQAKLNTLVASKSLPDIVWINEYLPVEWGEKGAIEDLTPYFEEAGINPEEEFIDAGLFKSSDGKIYGIAPSVATKCVYYNKELFKEAGVEEPSKDPNETWTWEEFEDACAKITTDRSGKHPGEDGFNKDDIATFGTFAPTFWLDLMPLLYSNHAGFANEDGTGLGLDSENGIEVLNDVQGLIEKGYAPSVALASNFPAGETMLMDGQVGILFSGTWLDWIFKDAEFDVGVAPTPRYDEASSIAWSGGYVMAANSEHKDAAFKFLQFLCDADANPYVKELNIPSQKKYYIGEEGNTEWTNPDLHTDDFMECIPGLMEIATAPENVTLKNFSAIVDQIVSPELDPVWLLEEEPEEAVQSIKEKTEGKWEGKW